MIKEVLHKKNPWKDGMELYRNRQFIHQAAHFMGNMPVFTSKNRLVPEKF